MKPVVCALLLLAPSGLFGDLRTLQKTIQNRAKIIQNLTKAREALARHQLTFWWSHLKGSCEAGRRRFDDEIKAASKRFGVRRILIQAIISVESSHRPHVISGAGAMGLMQLMPPTAREMGVEDPFNPRQNIAGGTRYLQYLLEGYRGCENQAVAAYHAGPHATRLSQATINYVRNVSQALTDLDGKLRKCWRPSQFRVHSEI